MSECSNFSIKLQWKVTIWTKWQIVIPNEVRKLLNLNPWDDLAIFTKNDMWIWMVKSENIDQVMAYMKWENEG